MNKSKIKSFRLKSIIISILLITIPHINAYSQDEDDSWWKIMSGWTILRDAVKVIYHVVKPSSGTYTKVITVHVVDDNGNVVEFDIIPSGPYINYDGREMIFQTDLDIDISTVLDDMRGGPEGAILAYVGNGAEDMHVEMTLYSKHEYGFNGPKGTSVFISKDEVLFRTYTEHSGKWVEQAGDDLTQKVLSWDGLTVGSDTWRTTEIKSKLDKIRQIKKINKVPVRLELKVTNAEVKGIKVPGIPQLKPSFFFPEAIPEVLVTVSDPDGNVKRTYKYFTGNDSQDENGQIIETIMGDLVTFNVYNPIGTVTAGSKPEITGLTGVDIFRWSRTGTVFCTPDIKPGGLKPWLATFDNIHIKEIYEWPDGKRPTWNDWTAIEDEDRNGYQLAWTANRRMDPSKHVYSPEYEYKKYKTFNNVEQRAAKRIGLQMQLLRLWQDKMANNAYTYKSDQANYFMGTDTDELLYFEHLGEYEDGTATNVFEIKSESNGQDPWQYIPESEGKELTYDANGYPEISHEFNAFMTEYFKYQEYIGGGNPEYTGHYNGYTIQDYARFLDKDGNILTRSGGSPGACETGCQLNWNRKAYLDTKEMSALSEFNNVKHPGKINISYLSESVSIPISVKSPFIRDYGFYGNVVGQRWPLEGDDVPFTLINVDINNLPQDAKFKLEIIKALKTNGYYEPAVIPAHGFSAEKAVSEFVPMTNFPEAGQATFHLTAGNSWYPITVSYSPTGNFEDYVIVGMKMIRSTKGPIIFSAPGSSPSSLANSSLILDNDDIDLKEGKGDFINLYQEDWRLFQTEEYSEPASMTFRIDDTGDHKETVYYKKYGRIYIFEEGSKVTFTTADQHPFGWQYYGNDYYVSFDRAAYRMPEDSLKIYLKYEVIKIEDQSIVHSHVNDRRFRYQWNDVGDYELKVTFSGNSISKSRSHKVIVKAEDEENRLFYRDLNRQIKRADIVVKDLPDDLVSKFGLDAALSLEVLEIANVLSEYSYNLGPRTNDDNVDRLAPYNDFYAHYEWYFDNGTLKIENLPKVQNWIDNYSPTSKWPSSWKNWIRHYDVYDHNVTDRDNANHIDNEIGDAIYNKNSLYKQTNWQRVLPWIAMTSSYGYRVRNETKPLVNIKEHFKYMMTGTAPPNYTLNAIPEYMPDVDKNNTELYNDLATGRKIIVEKGTADAGLSVYNIHPSIGQKVFMASNETLLARYISNDEKDKLKIDGKILESGFKVFPNPSMDGNLTVEIKSIDFSPIHITIYDMLGKEVFEHFDNVVRGLNRIKLGEGNLKLNPGIYILKAITRNRTEIGKVIFK